MRAMQLFKDKGVPAHAISDRGLAPVQYGTLMELRKNADDQGEHFVPK